NGRDDGPPRRHPKSGRRSRRTDRRPALPTRPSRRTVASLGARRPSLAGKYRTPPRQQGMRRPGEHTTEARKGLLKSPARPTAQLGANAGVCAYLSRARLLIRAVALRRPAIERKVPLSPVGLWRREALNHELALTDADHV